MKKIGIILLLIVSFLGCEIEKEKSAKTQKENVEETSFYVSPDYGFRTDVAMSIAWEYSEDMNGYYFFTEDGEGEIVSSILTTNGKLEVFAEEYRVFFAKYDMKKTHDYQVTLDGYDVYFLIALDHGDAYACWFFEEDGVIRMIRFIGDDSYLEDLVPDINDSLRIFSLPESRIQALEGILEYSPSKGFADFYGNEIEGALPFNSDCYFEVEKDTTCYAKNYVYFLMKSLPSTKSAQEHYVLSMETQNLTDERVVYEDTFMIGTAEIYRYYFMNAYYGEPVVRLFIQEEKGTVLFIEMMDESARLYYLEEYMLEYLKIGK